MYNSYKIVKSDKKTKIIDEINIHEITSMYGFSPKIINSSILYNKEDNIYVGNITIENIEGISINDKYGNNPENIPKLVWDQIRNIVGRLYYYESIEYINIIGSNFIEKDDKVYIINFDDAIFCKREQPSNNFLISFMRGNNTWNPDFIKK